MMKAYGGGINDCFWSILDDWHRTWLGSLLIIFGILSAAANGWLMSTIMISCKLTSRTIMIILNLAVGCLGRSLLGGFPFAATSLIAGRWLFGDYCCQLFAFLRQFFGVSQMATLALLSVERLIVSRYPVLGSRLSVSIYVWSIVACWIAACMWSTPPLLGVGRYGCDVTGLACEIDWHRTADHYHFGFNMSLLLIGYLIPVLITITCTWRALSSGKHHMTVTKHGLIQTDQHSMNKTTATLVTSLFIFWLPGALLALWALIIPLPEEYEARRAHLPLALVVLAPISSEVSSLVPVFVYLSWEPKLRRALLGLAGKPPKPRQIIRKGKGVRFTEPIKVRP